jgi:hypothetical protein
MNLLGKVFHSLRVWAGLADASEAHLTPGHGWLLPVPADARKQRDDAEEGRASRERGGRA